MVEGLSVLGHCGVSVPGFPVRVLIGKLGGVEASEECHHGVKDCLLTAIPARPVIAVEYLDHELARDAWPLFTLRDVSLAPGDARNAGVGACVVACDEMPDGCGDDVTVLGVRHDVGLGPPIGDIAC